MHFRVSLRQADPTHVTHVIPLKWVCIIHCTAGDDVIQTRNDFYTKYASAQMHYGICLTCVGVSLHNFASAGADSRATAAPPRAWPSPSAQAADLHLHQPSQAQMPLQSAKHGEAVTVGPGPGSGHPPKHALAVVVLASPSSLGSPPRPPSRAVHVAVREP
jgi:hypothetical protein